MSGAALRRLQDERRRQEPAAPDPPPVAHDPARPLLAWLLAGDARFTVTSARTGEHRTFRVSRTRRPGEASWTYFAWARGGHADPDTETEEHLRQVGHVVHALGAWYYVGELGPGSDGLWSHATAATREDGSRALVVLRWFLAKVQGGWDGQPGDVPAALLKSVRCARCRRPLTDRDSIARGLGPECFDKSMGGE